MKVHFSYGRRGLDLRLPDDRRIEVLRARPQVPLSDCRGAVIEALKNPIDSAPLASIARGRRDACIVISDITRPVPNRELLPPILETLEAAGIERGKITILIATGIHRPNEGAELIHLVGEAIAATYRCVNHFSQDAEACRHIGDTGDGIPVIINKCYLDADLKILTGLVEPHFWAGFSGGAKAILPGISSIETMRHMHGVEMIDACIANCGVIEGNAFRRAGLEVAAMAGVDFIVNVTVDEHKRATGVFAGGVDAAHRAAAKLCEEATAFDFEAPADLVIASGGGFPLDLTFYQAAKAITVAWLLLREGGRSLILSECSKGVGSLHFKELLDSARSPQHLLEMLYAPGFFMVDQWCAQVMARMQLENRIAVHAAGLSSELLARYGYEPVADPQAWIDARLASLPAKARIVAVPDGPYVYGRVAERVE